MNISRVTTISLVLAVAVLALAYANPLSAKGKECSDGDSRPKCDDDPAASGLTFMVEMDGAFAMVESTTSDGNELIGEREVTIVRPGFDPDPPPAGIAIACTSMTLDSPERNACVTWSNVFDVCDIYKISNIFNINGTDPYGPDQFTTTPGRKGQVGWEIGKFGGGVRVYFFTTIQSPIDPLNPWDVVLQLTSKCTYHADHLDDFPGRTLCTEPFLSEDEDNPTTTFEMTHFWSHANGKKNVVHAEPCHVGEGELFPSLSTLTITAQ